MARNPRTPDVTPPIFDPLSYKSLGVATAKALTECEITKMSQLPSFKGEGIYAIYYKGDFEPYTIMSEANDLDRWQLPIYVGKADPPGGRHGVRDNDGNDAEAQTNVTLSDSYCLRDRLRSHIRSINSAENLNLSDFWCKFMLVNQVWVGLGEGMMISTHKPIWNFPINGFGSNAPGAGRPGTAEGRSRWDTLHPGRAWARNIDARIEGPEQIAEEVRQLLAVRHHVQPDDFFDIE